MFYKTFELVLQMQLVKHSLECSSDLQRSVSNTCLDQLCDTYDDGYVSRCHERGVNIVQLTLPVEDALHCSAALLLPPG